MLYSYLFFLGIIPPAPKEITDIGFWNAFIAVPIGEIIFILMQMINSKMDPMVLFTTKNYLRQKLVSFIFGILCGEIGLLIIASYKPPLTFLKAVVSGGFAGSTVILLWPVFQKYVINNFRKLIGMPVITQEPIDMKTANVIQATPENPVTVTAPKKEQP